MPDNFYDADADQTAADLEELARKRQARRPDRPAIPEPEPPVAEPLSESRRAPIGESGYSDFLGGQISTPVRPPGTQTLEQAQTRADYARRRNEAVEGGQDYETATGKAPGGQGVVDLFGKLSGDVPDRNPARERVDPADLALPGQATATPPPARQSQVPQSQGAPSGGGGTNVAALFGATVGPDFDEQIAAMGREKTARGQLADAEIKGEGDIANLKRQQAQQSIDQFEHNQHVGQDYLSEIHKLTHAYASGSVDPDKWWKDKSVPQKIATIVGAGLLGFGGNAKLALDHVNGQIDRSIALQQGALERTRVAAGHAENLYQMFLNQSKNEQEAYDKTRATLLDAAMVDVARAAKAAKKGVQDAQMDQFIAALKMQRDELLLGLQKRAGAGGPAGPGGYMPLEGGATVATLRDGTQVYIGHGGEDVARSVEFSDRAEEAAYDLANYADPSKVPNPVTHPQDYQVYVAGLRERLKNVSVLGAQHLGTGGRGNVATMQAYRNAIAGPDNDPKGFWGAVADYPSLTAGGLLKSMSSSARTFAASVAQDRDTTIRAHGGLTGQTAIVGAHGTGEWKGQTIQKPAFVPNGQRYVPPTRPGYDTNQPDPTARFSPGP